MLLFSFLCLVARQIIQVIIPLRIHIESHPSVNLCPVFYFGGLFEMY